MQGVCMEVKINNFDLFRANVRIVMHVKNVPSVFGL